jgi:hypothetical protein
MIAPVLLASHFRLIWSLRKFQSAKKNAPGTGVTQGLSWRVQLDEVEVVQHEHRGKDEKDRLRDDYHEPPIAVVLPGQSGPKKKAPGAGPQVQTAPSCGLPFTQRKRPQGTGVT